MALLSTSTLNAGVKKREVFGWAMYDFANSGYGMVVLTAVFGSYFVGTIAGKAEWATFVWTLTLALANVIVMLSTPAIGAYADLHAVKKRLLMLATVGCVVFTAALALTGPGTVALAMGLVIAATTFYYYGESLIASFLPELAQRDSMGRVSGWGWGFGYFGGMLALGLSLAWVLHAKSLGQTAAQFVPVTLLITAVLYAAASLATFALLRERAMPRLDALQNGAGALKASLRQLQSTLRQARHYQDYAWLLGCAVCYQGGVAATYSVVAIYAEQVIGFAQQEVLMLIFLVSITGALGAFAFGYWQDAIGHKRALAITLVCWVATCAIAALATSKGAFWWAAALAGLCTGSSQSGGRALAGLFAPRSQQAEFFGLWTFATRLAAIIGLLSFGSISWATGGNLRLALVSTIALFIAGLLVLIPVDVQRGRLAAERAP